MICYRDKTYCSKPDCCNTDCSRMITDAVRTVAKRCELPLATCDFSGECGVYVSRDDVRAISIENQNLRLDLQEADRTIARYEQIMNVRGIDYE